MMLAICSCRTSTETFTFQAPVTGRVYIPGSDDYRSVAAGEEIEVALPSTAYYGFLIVEDSVTGLRIPAGLDVHNRNDITGLRITNGIGYGLTGAGLVTMVAGAGSMFGGGDGGGASLTTGIGMAATLAGLAIALPSQHRLEQMAYKYRFVYDAIQRPDVNGLTPTLLREDPPKEIPAAK